MPTLLEHVAAVACVRCSMPHVSSSTCQTSTNVLPTMEAVMMCAVTLMGPTHAPAPEDLCWVRTTIHAYVSPCSCWELCRVQGIGSVLPFFMCSASAPDSNCENGTHGCLSICDGDVCSCKNNTSFRLSRSRRHCVGMNKKTPQHKFSTGSLILICGMQYFVLYVFSL